MLGPDVVCRPHFLYSEEFSNQTNCVEVLSEDKKSLDRNLWPIRWVHRSIS